MLFQSTTDLLKYLVTKNCLHKVEVDMEFITHELNFHPPILNDGLRTHLKNYLYEYCYMSGTYLFETRNNNLYLLMQGVHNGGDDDMEIGNGLLDFIAEILINKYQFEIDKDTIEINLDAHYNIHKSNAVCLSNIKIEFFDERQDEEIVVKITKVLENKIAKEIFKLMKKFTSHFKITSFEVHIEESISRVIYEGEDELLLKPDSLTFEFN
mgnify:FL=1